jgi:hypothetical protein
MIFKSEVISMKPMLFSPDVWNSSPFWPTEQATVFVFFVDMFVNEKCHTNRLRTLYW